MREVYYFQAYHQGENAHSSNALLLLKRLYLYKSKLFYKILSSWLECDFDEIITGFYTQEKGKNKQKGNQSIPDFSISQGSFKIFVEAKEKGNRFNEQQMTNHLINIQKENVEKKVLIALAPSFSKKDTELFEKLNKNIIGAKILNLTYLDIYSQIKDELDENRDIEMIDILEEYREYCNEENLIDDTNSIVMARLAGNTIDFNVRDDVNLYFDDIKHNYEGFRYIALYSNKALKYVGKIQKVLSSDGKLLLSYTGDKVTDDDKQRLEKGKEHLLKTYNSTSPHAFYLVEKFVPIDNFKKESKHALYGRKKFYIEEYKGLKPNCSAEEIAECWKNKVW